MEENKSRKIYTTNYIITFSVASLCLSTLLLFNKHFYIPFILMIVGIMNIINVYKRDKLLMTPISIFSFMWLILIPICSFEFPIMREMSDFEWKIVLEFIMAFSFGALGTSVINNKNINVRVRKKLNSTTIFVNYTVLIVSIFSLLIMFIQFGGIPLFYTDANVGKDLFRTSSILNTLSYFGLCAILVFIMDNPQIIRIKKFDILALTYMLLLILSAERFFITNLIILCMLIFCKQKINAEFLKKIILAVFLIIGIFIFVLQYRGNSSQKKKYFIDTGIYVGEISDLTRTEIFRYLGMQERVLTNTFEMIEPGQTKGTLTFAPILKLFGIKPIEIPDVQIYGYTSKSIITKVYSDFGYLWFVAIIIISFIINSTYSQFSRKNNLFSQYNTILWLMFLLFSFYAYFDNFIIFFLHFPIYIILIELFNSLKKGGQYENNNYKPTY